MRSTPSSGVYRASMSRGGRPHTVVSPLVARTRWRWAPYPRAELRLDLPTPADRRLLLTARRPDEVASQRVELWLNGHHLGGHDLQSRGSTVSADAPREEWRPGVNELLLRFESRRMVEGVSRLAQVARLEVETVGEPALERSFDERGPLVAQPSRSSVDLFRRLPNGEARLLLEAGWRGGSSVRVAVDVEPATHLLLVEPVKEPCNRHLDQVPFELGSASRVLGHLRPRPTLRFHLARCQTRKDVQGVGSRGGTAIVNGGGSPGPLL